MTDPGVTPPGYRTGFRTFQRLPHTVHGLGAGWVRIPAAQHTTGATNCVTVREEPPPCAESFCSSAGWPRGSFWRPRRPGEVRGAAVQARKVLDHPTVQEATGVAQAQATRLYAEGKDKLANSKLGEKLSTTSSTTTTPASSLTATDDTFSGSRSTSGI